jgi:ParB-like chromosome segregation protein Spo0J
MKINEIKLNKNNPRIIKDYKFEKLKKSISEFPKMLELRPMVIDNDNVVLGGNMRLTALKDLGYKEIPDNWVKRASELTDEEKQRFVIADNVGFGDWDWNILANEWDSELIADWGLEVPSFEVDVDFSDKNKELDINDFDNEKYFFKLEYTETDYTLIKEKLQSIGKTPEQIFYEALI